MKKPISSYEDYCRVWAEVYKKHAKYSNRNVFSCYVRGGIEDALYRGELCKPKQEVTTDEDIIGIYIVRALVAQGMRKSDIMWYTEQMQDYVDDAALEGHDCIYLMEQRLCAMGVLDNTTERFSNMHNLLRYLWAKHGGFELTPADD